MSEDLFGDIPAAPTSADDLFGDIPEPAPTAPPAPSPARRWMADYGLRLYKAGYRPIPIKPNPNRAKVTTMVVHRYFTQALTVRRNHR